MRQTERSKFRTRLDGMFQNSPRSEDDDVITSSYLQSVWAKHLCVLTSGYLEQSIREIIVTYCATSSNRQVAKYIDKSWPVSKNMWWGTIKGILDKLNEEWGSELENWLAEEANRKGDINSIIEWRNAIAHGKDAETNGVTMPSVTNKYKTIKNLIDKIEEIVQPPI